MRNLFMLIVNKSKQYKICFLTSELIQIWDSFADRQAERNEMFVIADRANKIEFDLE